MAARYLQKALENLPDNFYLTGGHSREETWLLMQPVRDEMAPETMIRPSTAPFDSPGLQSLCHQLDGYQALVEGETLPASGNSIVGIVRRKHLRKQGLSKAVPSAALPSDRTRWQGDSFLCWIH